MNLQEIECPVRKAAYEYMLEKHMTMTLLGDLLGFNSRQAVHHWLTKGKRVTKRELEIKEILRSLGVDL